MHEGTTPALAARLAGTVRAHPDVIALDLPAGGLTYAELWRAAGAIAAHVPAGTRLGICTTPRSVAAYAGYLAGVRLGVTVVPLHPEHPAERLAYAAATAELDDVLVDGGTPEALVESFRAAGCRIVPVPDTLHADGPDLPAPEPDDVAYVLFTSGSTGQPKGVPVTHRNLLAYLDHVLARHDLGPGSRLSQTFELTFDPSVFDLLAGWCSGATVVVPRRSDLVRPVAYVTERRITHWYSVPSVVGIAQRTGALVAGSMPDLRCSVFIGEQLTLAQATAWAAAAPGSFVENVYGPTELTVSCTEHRLPRDPATWPATRNGTVPIGAVHPQLDHVVLDDDGEPAEVGELCVRGPQRFPGYLRTAENVGRFLELDGDRVTHWVDAERPPPPSAWYRTGDRVERRADGLLHLGRVDHQVKVRGHRIELGEIEAAIRRHPDVVDAVAVVAQRAGLDAIAVYYTGGAAPAAALAEQARSLVPRYMVPDEFVHLPELPVNANGKTDRRRLSEAAGGR